MAHTFAELGLRDELTTAAAGAGYVRPSAIQRGAIPVLRRGGNAVLNATAGSGVVAAYGLALLDRLAGAPKVGEGPRALVVVPTAESAAATARSLAGFARAVGLRVGSAGPGWASGPAADVLILAVPAVLQALQTSSLKLEQLEILVVDGLTAAIDLYGRETVESLLVPVPREAQRIVVSESTSLELDDFVERHVRRPLHIPARVVAERGTAAAAREPEPTVALGYVVVPAPEKAAAAAALLASELANTQTRIFCRTPAEAEAVAAELVVRGFHAATDPDGIVTVAGEARDRAPASGRPSPVLSFAVPLDAEMLLERHADGGLVVVEPRELAHLRRLAGESRVGLQPISLPSPRRTEVDQFRERLRRAAQEEDLSAQILVLEPLLGELSALELAAAAASLLRRSAAAPPVGKAATETAATGPAPPAWLRLFISVGSRDNLRPGDLVGAITGEAGIPGTAVGRVEIRDTFSIVEVTREHAERVLQALNGVTLKGRSVRADYDRKGASSAPPRRRTAGE